jgi:hypothetical protein
LAKKTVEPVFGEKWDKIKSLIANFEKELKKSDLRKKVLSLVPVFKELRKIGSNLISKKDASSAMDRILFYLKKYPMTVISTDEILVVSGIQEYARRIRELRVQFGWKIISGITVKNMKEEGDIVLPKADLDKMGPDDYMLTSTERDREAADRWNQANTIRKKDIGVREKILEFLRNNVGKQISGEELRYLADGATEWARRVRELRTEFGWKIVTKQNRPDLPVGVYIMESGKQSPEHDRKIPDPVRAKVLTRDGYKCTKCKWSYEDKKKDDPRTNLELHHKKEHVKGGGQEEENLTTLCNVCHDQVHKNR